MQANVNPPQHAAVVGAGIAGLSCATLLQSAGFAVSVFDKSRGPSGRMSTWRGDGWQCDHGAQYFTARQPDFRAEVARWQHAGVAASWRPRLHILGDPSAHVPDPDLERFVGLPRMSAPCRFLADGLDIEVGTTIRQLQRRADGWHLRSAERGWLERSFDVVLLALPAPQAAPLLSGVAADLAVLAGQVVMRGAWALMLRFSAPLELPFDAAFVNSGPLRWIARDNSKPGRGAAETWLLHANAAWSEAHMEDDADRVSTILQQAFADLVSVTGGLPEAPAWVAHRWRYADGATPLNHSCLWHAGSRIGLCGDWLNGGKVEGAWLSGRELGERVAAHFCDHGATSAGPGFAADVREAQRRL
ncbi:MAG: NAD(P)-binding protein [Azoarcus sp.]|nr:NAD(P)-binding protein [Azoarcus sp.]